MANKNLPISVKRAIKILKKAPYSIEYVPNDPHHCPIGSGFRVCAYDSWDIIWGEDKERLKKAGFDGRTYIGFIHWFDHKSKSNNNYDHVVLLQEQLSK
jgi:hypothetical protein